MSWDLRFFRHDCGPAREAVVTLRDAATYITTIPAATQQWPAWQSAVHVLLQAADQGGPIEFARLGMAQALYPKPAPVHHLVKKAPSEATTANL
jgi:hypothetical protein